MNCKRFLCVMLAACLLLSCVACRKNSSDDASTGATADKTNAFGTVGEGPNNTTAPENESPEQTEAQTTEAVENTTSAAAETQKATSSSSGDRFVYTFEPINDTVYTTSDLNIRREPYNDAEIVDVALKGTALSRVGYQEYWSQIEYNGEILYVGTKYLTTTPPEQ